MFPAAQSLLRRIILVILLSSGTVTVSFAGDDRWISIGPSGGGILALAVDPSNHSVVYVGTGGGIFKSTSGGANWTAINNGIRVRSNVISARAIAIDPTNASVVYAGVVNSIFKTTNGGFSWIEVKAGNGAVQVLVVDASDSNTIYAGLSDVGILRSTDGGTTWTPINTGLKRILDIAIDPSDRNTIYAATNEGIYKSANNGVTWNPVNEGLTQMQVHSLTIDPSNPALIYAGTFDGLFRSTNAGGSWKAVDIGGTFGAGIFQWPSKTTEVSPVDSDPPDKPGAAAKTDLDRPPPVVVNKPKNTSGTRMTTRVKTIVASQDRSSAPNSLVLRTGDILLVRHEGKYGAVQAVEQVARHRGSFIRYFWWYQPDGSGVFINKNVLTGSGETREEYPTPGEAIDVGPIKLEWSIRGAAEGYVYFRHPDRRNIVYELIIARTKDIASVDARLEFKRVE